MTRIAAIQMASGPKVSANLTEAGRLIARAADAGAGMVVLPENFACMSMQDGDQLKYREREGEGPIQNFLQEQADKHRVWLVGGTIPLFGKDELRMRASCLIYDERGVQRGRYDKIHLFDVLLEENQETYHESATTEPDRKITVIDTPFGRLGLAICYDLRFPELFRRMLNEQVDIFAIPSAFTAITGRAHWEVLVRARAIENLCYVVASAQGGYHVNGRETHGHSMIVDPWGVVQDELDNGSGFVIAEVDMDRIKNIRRTFPVLEHRKIPCDIGYDK
ncbi:MAG TPA: carbon-nitrogen hydrolase family protein [Gammaproteobacteria bacterium]|nr:carbon-nitrogen hydrolase family protein [Gammaproteobacteria bacterium]